MTSPDPMTSQTKRAALVCDLRYLAREEQTDTDQSIRREEAFTAAADALERLCDPQARNSAYREINALGGTFDRTDTVAVARDEQLGVILAILEKHGASE